MVYPDINLRLFKNFNINMAPYRALLRETCLDEAWDLEDIEGCHALLKIHVTKEIFN